MKRSRGYLIWGLALAAVLSCVIVFEAASQNSVVGVLLQPKWRAAAAAQAASAQLAAEEAAAAVAAWEKELAARKQTQEAELAAAREKQAAELAAQKEAHEKELAAQKQAQESELAAQRQAQATAVAEDTDQLQQWKLMHSMMYWAHSHPVPRPSAGPLYPVSAEPKYITWEQDGAGLNNVRLQVETLVVMAHAFGRTLVMPDHLAGAMDHMGGDNAPRFDQFFDFVDLRRWTPVISMNEYLTFRNISADDKMRTDMFALRDFLRGTDHEDAAYPDWSANGDALPVPNLEVASQRQHPTFDEFASRSQRRVNHTLEQQQARTLHFKVGDGVRLMGHVGGFFYWPSQAWQDYMFAGLRDHFHLHRDIFANASRIVHHLQRQKWGGGHAWNAVHDRTGDFVRQFEGYYVDELTLRDHLVQAFNGTGEPLYIATAEVNDTRWAPILEAFPRTVFLKDIVAEVLPGVPSVFLGAIEQVVCSVAARFVATMGSSFSAYVHRLRGHHHASLVPDKGIYYTNWPQKPEDWAAALADNTWQREAVWWPPSNWQGPTWGRAFEFTYNFSASSMPRSDSVFQPAH